jgi:hypothetical protein
LTNTLPERHLLARMLHQNTAGSERRRLGPMEAVPYGAASCCPFVTNY